MAKSRKEPEFDPRVLDAMIGGRESPEEVDELFRQMKKALMERILSGELTHTIWATGKASPHWQPASFASRG